MLRLMMWFYTNRTHEHTSQTRHSTCKVDVKISPLPTGCISYAAGGKCQIYKTSLSITYTHSIFPYTKTMAAILYHYSHVIKVVMVVVSRCSKIYVKTEFPKVKSMPCIHWNFVKFSHAYECI